MRVSLPNKLMDEYWDKPKDVRKVLVNNAFGLFLNHELEGAIQKLEEEGWSHEFAAWLIPNIEKFRSSLEIDALPYVEDFEGELKEYEAWKVRKKALLRPCLVSISITILSFVSIFILAASVSKEDYNQVSPFLAWMVILSNIAFAAFLMRYKGRSPWLGLCALFCGPGLIFVLVIPDLNTLPVPVKPANYDEELRLFQKVQAVRAAEAAGS